MFPSSSPTSHLQKFTPAPHLRKPFSILAVLNFVLFPRPAWPLLNPMSLVEFQLPASPAGTLLFNLQSPVEIALCPPAHPRRASVFIMRVHSTLLTSTAMHPKVG